MILEHIPEKLKKIQNPCQFLHYKGDLDLLDSFKVAIVGSRKPSEYTRSFVMRLSSEIARRGGVVVSGGALGVDTVAHKGAGDRTIGVFANSLDLVYPKTSKNTIERIYENGLALSEYEETTYARPYYFVQRNRIVTGISDIIVIAQADLESGSMRSADFAYEQGKPIFVLPHRVGESEGTNLLLKNCKARAIYDIDCFLEEIGLDKVDEPTDEILEYCKSMPSYESAYNIFGDKILEYELEGKIQIDNMVVRIR
ncbi:MAG: DNA-protecting protein DprA [Campylobacterales bacterium]|nr:DNA-protecting protein DprA [Campylobacterales bacterium]